MNLARTAAVLALIGAMAPPLAHAQGVSDSSIVGSEREIIEISRDVSEVGLDGLLENAEDTADRIRMLTDPEEVTIVQLGERRTAVTEEIEQFMRDHQPVLVDLRNAVQINAVLFEILNAKGIGAPEVLAADVDEDDSITVYAFATQAPGN